MSFAAEAIIDLSARLRLACASLSEVTGQRVTPDDVRLGDVDPAVADRLRAEGTADFWRLVCADPSTAPEVPHAEDEAEARRADRARGQDHEAGRRGLAG